jgi:hypothetical protein
MCEVGEGRGRGEAGSLGCARVSRFHTIQENVCQENAQRRAFGCGIKLRTESGTGWSRRILQFAVARGDNVPSSLERVELSGVRPVGGCVHQCEMALSILRTMEC